MVCRRWRRLFWAEPGLWREYHATTLLPSGRNLLAPQPDCGDPSAILMSYMPSWLAWHTHTIKRVCRHVRSAKLELPEPPGGICKHMALMLMCGLATALGLAQGLSVLHLRARDPCLRTLCDLRALRSLTIETAAQLTESQAAALGLLTALTMLCIKSPACEQDALLELSKLQSLRHLDVLLTSDAYAEVDLPDILSLEHLSTSYSFRSEGCFFTVSVQSSGAVMGKSCAPL
jgi:hypothetical protein